MLRYESINEGLECGKGQARRAQAYFTLKQLLRVVNKLTAFYKLDQTGEAGITETGIIAAPETNAHVEGGVGHGSR